MRIGNYVKHKTDGTIGIVTYSTFGLSVHFWDATYNAMGKTLGVPKEEAEKHWEVIDELPKGYWINGYGVPSRIN